MIVKTYLSNIDKRWPLEKQRLMLGGREREYTDILRPAALKRRSPSELIERATLLRPTSRDIGEVIEVASFQVLAWTPSDFCDVITAASARKAVLRALDTGHEIEPHMEAARVAEEIKAFTRIAKARGLSRSPAEIAEERRRDTERRIALIADDWPKSEHSTVELLARAGVKPGKPMAPATAKAHLGSRPERQASYQRELNREAGRAEARARKKEETYAA